MSDNDKRYLGILMEELRGQYSAILEGLGDMQRQLADVPKRNEFDELKQDTRIIKAAVTDLSHQVRDHEFRITKLETNHHAA